ncbi:hypothetical protein GA0115246_1147215 [Streptomyces sp. SolWspMP-sol7th]|nr:hypothetical protein GA0115246_1147215 [Streptomyces sp. SolWspMP-sol7th]
MTHDAEPPPLLPPPRPTKNRTGPHGLKAVRNRVRLNLFPSSAAGRARGRGVAERGAQAFLVSQKILSIWAIRSSAFWPVAGSFEPLAAERALRVSLTSWCSSGYFSKCGALK